MSRFTSNQLRGSFELGNTSSWVVSFESVGQNSPDVSKLNLIAGKFCPVSDVEYDQYTVTTHNILVGPGLEINVPVYAADHPHSITMTIYDEHKKTIRTFIRNWATKTLKLTKGQAPVLSKLKDSCLLVRIQHFDKQLNNLSNDSFYILPMDSLAFRGDQAFSADTIPLTFNVVGTQ